MDLAYTLAEHIAKVKYEDIPAEVVAVTKKSILDTLGVIVGGSTSPGVKGVIDLVKEGGGKEESTIIAYGGKVPAWMAAFANGAMAHQLDYDDTFEAGYLHPSPPNVCAGFAIAERIGKVSGKEFITAITLGNDMICRIGLSIAERPKGFKADWHMNPVIGPFSGGATAGKLLGLDQEELVDVFGLALHQAAGTYEMAYSVGAMVRAMYNSFGAKAGVLSALLAQRGVTGSKNSFQGKRGFFNVYFEGEFDEASLLGDLGKRFEGIQTAFKPWPACRASHAYIEVTLALVREHDIHPQDVKEITAFVGEQAQHLCEPLEGRRKPATSMDAKFSVPFVIANAIRHRKVVIKHFSPDGLTDPSVLQLAQKVTPKFDPQFNPAHGSRPGKVEIKMKDGKAWSEGVEFAYGNPKNPMPMRDIIEKFRDCTSYSVKPLPKKNVDRTIDLVNKLETVDDVSQVIQLLS